MRVLHLIDDGGPAGRAVAGGLDPVLHACRVVHQTPHRHEVCVVGGAELESDARAAGLNVLGRISPALGDARLAGRALARVLADRGVHDAMQGWSPAAIRIVRGALRRGPLPHGGAPRIGATLLEAPPRDAECARRAARHIGDAHAIVISEASRDEWITAGLDPARIAVAAPPVADSAPGQREQLRRLLRLGPQERAVILLGSSPHADAVRWIFFHGILGIAGTRFTGIVTRQAGQFDRGMRYFLSAPPKNRLIASDVAAARLIHAADAAVYEGGGYGPTTGLPPRPAAATLPIAIAHAAGVPVVAPAWAGDPRLYPAGSRDLLLGTNASLPELARVLMRLLDRPGDLARMQRLVRPHAAGQDHAAFARAHDAVWAGHEADRAPLVHTGPVIARARQGAAL